MGSGNTVDLPEVVSAKRFLIDMVGRLGKAAVDLRYMHFRRFRP